MVEAGHAATLETTTKPTGHGACAEAAAHRAAMETAATGMEAATTKATAAHAAAVETATAKATATHAASVAAATSTSTSTSTATGQRHRWRNQANGRNCQ